MLRSLASPSKRVMLAPTERLVVRRFLETIPVPATFTGSEKVKVWEAEAFMLGAMAHSACLSWLAAFLVLRSSPWISRLCSPAYSMHWFRLHRLSCPRTMPFAPSNATATHMDIAASLFTPHIRYTLELFGWPGSPIAKTATAKVVKSRNSVPYFTWYFLKSYYYMPQSTASEGLWRSS